MPAQKSERSACPASRGAGCAGGSAAGCAAASLAWACRSSASLQAGRQEARNRAANVHQAKKIGMQILLDYSRAYRSTSLKKESSSHSMSQCRRRSRLQRKTVDSGRKDVAQRAAAGRARRSQASCWAHPLIVAPYQAYRPHLESGRGARDVRDRNYRKEERRLPLSMPEQNCADVKSCEIMRHLKTSSNWKAAKKAVKRAGMLSLSRSEYSARLPKHVRLRRAVFFWASPSAARESASIGHV